LAQLFGFTIPLEIEEKPGIPPSARHRDHVVETIKQLGIHTVLQEPYYDRAAADYLAANTSVHIVVAPNDVGDEVGAKDYFALIDNVLSRLVESESKKSD
jgi:zinc/manganese transport system substrate-binding protein